MILVTGASDFIGSNFVLDWLAQSDEPFINLDDLTYAGNLENLASLDGDSRQIFVKGSICDFDLFAKLLDDHKPRAGVNFAAVTAFDLVAMQEAQRIFCDDFRLQYAENPMGALTRADALVITTKLKESRSPVFEAIKQPLKSSVIFEGRNRYCLKVVRDVRIEYFAIGR